MTPTNIYIDQLPQTKLGPLWVALSDKGLWALEFQVSEEEFIQEVQGRGPVEINQDANKTQATLKQVSEYLEGQLKDFSLPVDWSGMTDFQINVRKAVMAIPAGETASYGEIAAQIGNPRASRGVGRANATNPIPLVIPCHRVIGANGALTGYGGAGGLDTKRWLLDLEKKGNRDQ